MNLVMEMKPDSLLQDFGAKSHVDAGRTFNSYRFSDTAILTSS